MALPKQHDDLPDEQPEQGEAATKRLFGRAERIQAIFEDLLEGAPDDPDDSGWEELKRALDEHRPEGAKLFPDT